MYLFRKKSSKMDFIEHFKSLPSAIMYDNDNEYRNVIRNVFNFDRNTFYDYHGKIKNLNEVDPISKDELLYDSEAVTHSMNFIYNATKNNGEFSEMYLKAAARMFSTDPQIGQAVLCSYDTFHWYYSCVWFFLNGGHSSLVSCNDFKNLNTYLE